jgi:hypothetical protein
MSHEINTRSAGSDPLPTTLFGSYVWGPEVGSSFQELLSSAGAPPPAADKTRFQHRAIGSQLEEGRIGVVGVQLSPSLATARRHRADSPRGANHAESLDVGCPRFQYQGL